MLKSHKGSPVNVDPKSRESRTCSQPKFVCFCFYMWAKDWRLQTNGPTVRSSQFRQLPIFKEGIPETSCHLNEDERYEEVKPSCLKIRNQLRRKCIKCLLMHVFYRCDSQEELSFNMIHVKYSQQKTKTTTNKCSGNNNTRHKTKAEKVDISELTRKGQQRKAL